MAGDLYSQAVNAGSDVLAGVVHSAVVQNVLQSQVVQTVVQSPEVQEMMVNQHPALLHTCNSLLRDQRLWYLLGGTVLGAYFGFRIGVVSGRARRYVASIQWMKAAAINSYDGVKAITVQNLEVPQLVNPTDVLIEVKAASLDPVDIKVSQGYGRGLRELVARYSPNNRSATGFPVVLGRDGAGLVREVGDEVTGLRPGDRVWFTVPACMQGSLSTFTVLDSSFIRLLPDSLTFEAGATLPYSGMVVWDLLVTSGGLGPGPQSKGKTVFLWGGVRAVERLCVQLCAVWGCQVTCVAPLYTHEYLRSLGARHLILDDMDQVNLLVKSGTRFDVVVNTAGLIAEDLCLQLTKQDGRVVTMLTQTPGLTEYGLYTNILAGCLNSIWDIFKTNLFGGERAWHQTQLRGEVLDYLAELINSGNIDPVGERIYNLEQVELAFKCLAGGGHKGKIVIRLDSSSSSMDTNQLIARR